MAHPPPAVSGLADDLSPPTLAPSRRLPPALPECSQSQRRRIGMTAPLQDSERLDSGLRFALADPPGNAQTRPRLAHGRPPEPLPRFWGGLFPLAAHAGSERVPLPLVRMALGHENFFHRFRVRSSGSQPGQEGIRLARQPEPDRRLPLGQVRGSVSGSPPFSTALQTTGWVSRPASRVNPLPSSGFAPHLRTFANRSTPPAAMANRNGKGRPWTLREQASGCGETTGVG